MGNSAVISGLLLGVPALLIGLGLVGLLLLPMHPVRLLAGMALVQAGSLLFLIELAAFHSDAGIQPSAAAPEGVVARLHGLGLAVILIGVALQAILVAVLMALKRRAGSLEPERLDALSAAEWWVALGEESSVAPEQKSSKRKKS